MRYRFSIARKPALALCLLIIALWAPRSLKRRDSPRLIALDRNLKAGNRAALKIFWEEVQGKTPLIEPVRGDDRVRRVTFLWRGGAEGLEVRLDGALAPDPTTER